MTNPRAFALALSSAWDSYPDLSDRHLFHLKGHLLPGAFHDHLLVEGIPGLPEGRCPVEGGLPHLPSICRAALKPENTGTSLALFAPREIATDVSSNFLQAVASPYTASNRSSLPPSPQNGPT